MGESKTVHFHHFWIFEPVISSQHQLFLHLATPGHLKPKKTSVFFVFINLGIVKLQKMWHFSKRWAPKNDEDPSKEISKLLNMGSISS